MKIKRLTFNNFRNFKGSGSIECSTDGRVTIIYGVNGSGKTTLHQLFYWVIYGETHFNKTTGDKMYNLEFEREQPSYSTFSVVGSIDFEHDGKDYSMRREWKYQKSYSETKRSEMSFDITIKDSDNNWVPYRGNPNDFIERILPSGLSEYFFFDGESMITDLKAKGKDSAGSLRKAMFLMLDLSIYERAVNYLGSKDQKTSAIGNLFLSKTEVVSGQNLSGLRNTMVSAQNKRDNLKKSRDDLKESNNKLIKRIEDISEQIGSAKSQEQYEKERQECKARRDGYIEDSKKDYAQFGEELINVFPKAMMSKVVENAKKLLSDQASTSNLVQGVNKELVDALLKEDRCICGRPLHDEEKKNLESLYNYLPPLGYGSLYINFTNKVESWGKEYDSERLQGHITDAIRHLENADKEDRNIDDIDTTIAESKEYAGLAKERTEKEAEIKKNEARLSDLEKELGKADLYIKKLEKQITDVTAADAKNKKIDRQVKIMERVRDDFDDLLAKKADEYSKKLQTNIQELLDSMLEAKRRVYVNSDFSLRVSDNFDDESKSEGQFATVSFAYIGGIFKLLRDEDMLSNKEYPLVLDAPFSKLGDEPRQKVIDTIPEYAPQIILFSKDNLQDCFDEDRIGNVYTITTNENQNVAEVKEGFLWT